MVILALETVTRRGSLALLCGEVVHARAGAATRTHGERLPGEVIDFLGQYGCRLQDVDRFAIIAGPGSFTGLRVGMAAVQGFALTTGRLVTPVPTLAAMAEAWRLHHRTSSMHSARIVVTEMDGQRGDVFFGAWEPTADATEMRVLVEASVGRPDDVSRLLRSLGPRPTTVVSDTDGDAEWLPLSHVVTEPMTLTLAEAAVRLAERHPGLAGPPHALRPIYIRRPDAVLARERRAPSLE
jgi:tRNA threonylcarbamoyl adenosine modification protein YeaZ